MSYTKVVGFYRIYLFVDLNFTTDTYNDNNCDGNHIVLNHKLV